MQTAKFRGVKIIESCNIRVKIKDIFDHVDYQMDIQSL